MKAFIFVLVLFVCGTASACPRQQVQFFQQQFVSRPVLGVQFVQAIRVPRRVRRVQAVRVPRRSILAISTGCGGFF